MSISGKFFCLSPVDFPPDAGAWKRQKGGMKRPLPEISPREVSTYFGFTFAIF